MPATGGCRGACKYVSHCLALRPSAPGWQLPIRSCHLRKSHAASGDGCEGVPRPRRSTRGPAATPQRSPAAPLCGTWHQTPKRTAWATAAVRLLNERRDDCSQGHWLQLDRTLEWNEHRGSVVRSDARQRHLPFLQMQGVLQKMMEVRCRSSGGEDEDESF